MIRFSIGVAIILCSLNYGSAPVTAQETTELATPTSLANIATDDFFAAALMKPAKLRETVLADSHPFASLIPHAFSPSRLNSLPIEELLVLVGDARSNSQAADFDSLELALVANLDEEVPIPQVVEAWNQSVLIPGNQELRDRQTTRLLKRKLKKTNQPYFEAPAGTFFQKKHRYGSLSFTDQQGRPAEKGINVGYEFDYRGFFEGDSKGSAIYRFEDVKESTQISGNLRLQLNISVFPTHRQLPQEYSVEIWLRNPENGVRTVPIKVPVTSHIDVNLEFPSQLAIVNKDKSQRQGTLLDDLLVGNKLEVVIAGNRRGIYFGVGENSLSIVGQQREYLASQGKQVVVAQSLDRMQELIKLNTSNSKLARLLKENRSDLTVVAEPKDQNRQVLKPLLTEMGLEPIAGQLSQSMQQLVLEVNTANNRKLLSATVKQSSDSDADRLKSTLRSELHARLPRFQRQLITDGIKRLMARTGLLEFTTGGMSVRLFSPEDAEKVIEQTASLFDELFSGFKIENKQESVHVAYELPKKLAELSRADQLLLSLYDEMTAHTHFSRERFDAGVEALRRACQRSPERHELWIRAAHQLTFNQPPEFEGEKLKYSWVRRGILTLLAGANENPESVDLLFATTVFVGAQLGRSDDSLAFSKYFLKDQELHQQLARYINLEQAKASNGEIHSLLVARELAQHCVRMLEESSNRSAVSEALVYAQPAYLQSDYAILLDKTAQTESAATAWNLAAKKHQEFRQRLQRLKEKGVIKELKPRTLDELTLKKKMTLEQYFGVDYWRARCDLENSRNLRRARSFANAARQQVAAANLSEALMLYRKVLEELTELDKQRSGQLELCASDVIDLVQEFQSVHRSVTGDENKPHATVEKIIKAAQKTRLRNPLIGTMMGF